MTKICYKINNNKFKKSYLVVHFHLLQLNMFVIQIINLWYIYSAEEKNNQLFFWNNKTFKFKQICHTNNICFITKMQSLFPFWESNNNFITQATTSCCYENSQKVRTLQGPAKIATKWSLLELFNPSKKVETWRSGKKCGMP